MSLGGTCIKVIKKRVWPRERGQEGVILATHIKASRKYLVPCSGVGWCDF